MSESNLLLVGIVAVGAAVLAALYWAATPLAALAGMLFWILLGLFLFQGRRERQIRRLSGQGAESELPRLSPRGATLLFVLVTLLIAAVLAGMRVAGAPVGAIIGTLAVTLAALVVIGRGR